MTLPILTVPVAAFTTKEPVPDRLPFKEVVAVLVTVKVSPEFKLAVPLKVKLLEPAKATAPTIAKLLLMAFVVIAVLACKLPP